MLSCLLITSGAEAKGSTDATETWAMESGRRYRERAMSQVEILAVGRPLPVVRPLRPDRDENRAQDGRPRPRDAAATISTVLPGESISRSFGGGT